MSHTYNSCKAVLVDKSGKSLRLFIAKFLLHTYTMEKIWIKFSSSRSLYSTNFSYLL